MCINTDNCINIICTVLYKYILHVPAFLLAGVWSRILYICLHVALFLKCLGNSTLCVRYILYIPAFLSPVLRSQATSWVACVASWDTDGKIDTCDLTDEHAAVWTVWGWRATRCWHWRCWNLDWMIICLYKQLRLKLLPGMKFWDVAPLVISKHRWERTTETAPEKVHPVDLLSWEFPCWLCDCWRSWDWWRV